MAIAFAMSDSPHRTPNRGCAPPIYCRTGRGGATRGPDAIRRRVVWRVGTESCGIASANAGHILRVFVRGGSDVVNQLLQLADRVPVARRYAVTQHGGNRVDQFTF